MKKTAEAPAGDVTHFRARLSHSFRNTLQRFEGPECLRNPPGTGSNVSPAIPKSKVYLPTDHEPFWSPHGLRALPWVEPDRRICGLGCAADAVGERIISGAPVLHV